MASAKIVMLGMGGVGKSAFTLQFFSSTFVETYDPTLEDSYRKTIEVDDIPIVLNIYDTAGQEEFYSIRDQYIRIGEAFIFMYSITSKETLESIKDLRNRVVDLTDEEKQIAVLFGNKNDLEKIRVVSTEAGQEMADQFGWSFFEGSAKYKTNVNAAFAEIVRMIRREQLLRSPRNLIENLNEPNTRPRRRSGVVSPINLRSKCIIL